MTNKTYVVVGIIVVAVLIIAGGAYWLNQSYKAPTSQTTTENNNNNTSGENTTSGNGNTPAPTAATLAYEAALKLYGTDRIQFGDKCVILPIDPTFKKGTAVMFDNRSSTAKTITLDTTDYVIPAYDYK